MGRPRKTIDPKRVIELASIGYTMKEIAALENISEDTLHRRFVGACEKGRTLAAAQIRRKQFEKALAGNGDTTMLIWLGKQLLGQRDKGSNFAYSLSLRNNILAIGSANDPNDTAVFVYERPATGWATTAQANTRLTSSDGYGFGFSVSVGGGVIVAGSIGKNNLQGAAYVYGPE